MRRKVPSPIAAKTELDQVVRYLFADSASVFPVGKRCSYTLLSISTRQSLPDSRHDQRRSPWEPVCALRFHDALTKDPRSSGRPPRRLRGAPTARLGSRLRMAGNPIAWKSPRACVKPEHSSESHGRDEHREFAPRTIGERRRWPRAIDASYRPGKPGRTNRQLREQNEVDPRRYRTPVGKNAAASRCLHEHDFVSLDGGRWMRRGFGSGAEGEATDVVSSAPRTPGARTPPRDPPARSATSGSAVGVQIIALARSEPEVALITRAASRESSAVRRRSWSTIDRSRAFVQLERGADEGSVLETRVGDDGGEPRRCERLFHPVGGERVRRTTPRRRPGAGRLLPPGWRNTATRRAPCLVDEPGALGEPTEGGRPHQLAR